jgi:AraC-like DNA-binding protein
MSAVSVKLLQAIVTGAAMRGAAPDELLGAADLQAEQLADPDGRVPGACELRLWREATRLTGDDCLGLHMAESLPIAAHGALGFAVRGSATLGDAYQRVARFVHLARQGVGLQLARDGALVWLRHVPPAGEPPPSRHSVEWFMANLLMIARRGGDPASRPRAVRFRHPAPTRTDEHRRFFGPGVRFSQAEDELALDAALLAQPQREAEPALADLLDQHLEAALANLPAESGLLARVRRGVVEELRQGREPALETLARRLHMSPRSLQRRLREEHTTLQALLARLRADLAVRYLGEADQSISEVAFLLGFSEMSTFHRAFKRWTGVTPAAYRRGHRGGHASGSVA